MKATGIIRKMDKLGRVVIPSEIRETYHIGPGDAVEFYTNAGTVVIAKTCLGDMIGESVNDLRETVKNCSDSIPSTLKNGLYSHLRAMEELVESVKRVEC